MTRDRLFLFDTTLRDGQQTQGVQFSTAEKAQIALALDALGSRLHRGRLARREPDRLRLLRRPTGHESHPHRLRHDPPRGPVGRERRRPRRRPEREHTRRLPGRQDPRFPRHHRPERHPGREPRGHRLLDPPPRRQGPRAPVRRRALLRRLPVQPRLRPLLPARRPRRRCPLDRPLRHQRRHASVRGGPRHVRGDRRRHPRRPPRHPLPRRHRQRCRQLAGRRGRRRPADPGHAERPGRALREREPDHADPDASAEGTLRQPLRDRRHPRGAGGASRRPPACWTIS